MFTILWRLSLKYVKIVRNFLKNLILTHVSIYFSIIFCTQLTKATWHDEFIKDEDSNTSREYDIFLIVKYETLLDHFIDTCMWLYLVKELVLYDLQLIFNLIYYNFYNF